MDLTSTARELEEVLEAIRGNLMAAGVGHVPGVLAERMKSLLDALGKAAASSGTQQPIRVQNARHWAIRICAVLDASGIDNPRDAARRERAKTLIAILLAQLERLGHTLH
jgi:hypothetical protein